jgi:hypothetical protein
VYVVETFDLIQVNDISSFRFLNEQFMPEVPEHMESLPAMEIIATSQLLHSLARRASRRLSLFGFQQWLEAEEAPTQLVMCTGLPRDSILTKGISVSGLEAVVQML